MKKKFALYTTKQKYTLDMIDYTTLHTYNKIYTTKQKGKRN